MPEKNEKHTSISTLGGYAALKRFADARDKLRKQPGLNPLGYSFDYETKIIKTRKDEREIL